MGKSVTKAFPGMILGRARDFVSINFNLDVKYRLYLEHFIVLRVVRQCNHKHMKFPGFFEKLMNMGHCKT